MQRPGGREPRRIATSGTYRPRPGDVARDIVDWGTGAVSKGGWEDTPFACPTNAARVIGRLSQAPKNLFAL